MALFPKVGRKHLSMRLTWGGVTGILWVGVFLHLVPFYFMISTSLKSGAETLADPPTFWPQNVTFSAWTLVFSLVTGRDSSVTDLLPDPFYVYFWNSLFMTMATLIISLPLTSLAAYAQSKLHRGPTARWLFLLFIGTLMVPGAVTLLPKLLLTLNFPFALPQVPKVPGTEKAFPTFPVWDTPWAVILPGVYSAFNFLVFKGFFDTIPNSVLQAARVDGGTELNIFRRIVLPMSIPVYAVAAWLQFSTVWDDFIWPLLAFRETAHVPTSVAIYTLMNKLVQFGATDASQGLGQSQVMRQAVSAGLTWNGLMVLGILQTLPIFIMFIICREHLLKGIRVRGLK